MIMSSAHQSPLSILCFGMGAIGTYVGGSLAKSGEQVTFLERPGIGMGIVNQGLNITIEEREYIVQNFSLVHSLETALAEKKYDFAILAIKAYDTAGFLESLKPVARMVPPIVCLQNGVENELLLASVLGEERVIAGTVTSAIGRRGMGQIVVERLRGVGIQAGHPFSQTIYHAFSKAGLNPALYANAQSMKWSKLLTNLLANATSAILDLSPAEIFVNPQLFQLEMRMLREALAVMRAKGIPVCDLPRTQVRLLTWMARWLPEWLARPIARGILGRGRGGKMPSFHIELHSGNPRSEVDYLNGAVVRFGEQLGIPTPVNRCLTTILSELTRGDLALEEFARQPEKLISYLEETS